jgi:hypothetical protein
VIIGQNTLMLKVHCWFGNLYLTYCLSVVLSWTLVWPMPFTQMLPRPQLIFPSKTWFFGIYLNFQCQKSLKNQYLQHSLGILLEEILILEFKRVHFKNNLLHCKSKCHGTKPMHMPHRELSKDTKNTIWSILIWWIS